MILVKDIHLDRYLIRLKYINKKNTCLCVKSNCSVNDSSSKQHNIGYTTVIMWNGKIIKDTL